MPYPGNTIDTAHFVIVINSLIQIVYVETYGWGILYNERIRLDQEIFNLYINQLIDHMRLNLNL